METDLYSPVKTWLEKARLQLRARSAGCDVVALRAGEKDALVVVELKTAFNLDLVPQAVDRMAACDEVWVAVPASRGGRGRSATGASTNCAGGRRRPHDRFADGLRRTDRRAGTVEAARRQQAPFPHHGGASPSPGRSRARGSTRTKIMTAYRQQALACAAAMIECPRRPRDLKLEFPDAPKILQGNVYGWFSASERGIYGLTPAGRAALETWERAL